MSKPLVFLIGAGRSGTTLLYKLLSLHADVGFISNYNDRLPPWVPASLFVRLIKQSTQMKLAYWFGSGGNAYLVHRPWLKRLMPTPAEGESLYQYCGFPLHPSDDYRLPDKTAGCMRESFLRMHRLSGTKIFMTKRTANNRRIPLIRETFPDALFINLIRDGRDVAYSLSKVEWWNDHTVFWAGQTPPELEKQGMHPLKISAKNWSEEVRISLTDLATVPTRNKIDIRYESLLDEPIVALQRLLEFMGLETNDSFNNAITSLALSRRESNWIKKWSDDELEIVMTEQANQLKQLNYIN